MRIAILVIFALACLLAVSNAQKGKPKCDRKCPKEIKPVCATKDKGKTYKKFNNDCLLEIENCKTNNAYKKVDIKKCKK